MVDYFCQPQICLFPSNGGCCPRDGTADVYTEPVLFNNAITWRTLVRRM
jgi:hypothetical protein